MLQLLQLRQIKYEEAEFIEDQGVDSIFSLTTYDLDSSRCLCCLRYSANPPSDLVRPLQGCSSSITVIRDSQFELYK
jgi:hypothetical protein